MRTPFESENILIQSGPVRFLYRLLEFMYPVSYSVLNDEPDMWHGLEVPQYRPDDPARPLGYHESGARLIKRESIGPSFEGACTRASDVGRGF